MDLGIVAPRVLDPLYFHLIGMIDLIWFELNVLLFHWWFDWMRWIGAVAFGGVMGRNAPNGSAKESRPAQPIHQFQLNKNKNNERSWLNEELNEINKWSTKQPRCAASQKKSKTAINQLSFQNWRNERVGLICFWFLAERAGLLLWNCWVIGRRPISASDFHSKELHSFPFHLSWFDLWTRRQSQH